MIIAEIGLNHMGSEEYLMSYIESLADTPIDAITIQVREDDFYKNSLDNTELILTKNVYEKAVYKIKSGKKKFGVAISNLNFIPFFRGKVDFYKILSKDINNIELINELINKDDIPVFVSTGMSSYNEIFSFLKHVKKNKLKNLRLIHTRLSNKIEDTNLKAIQEMKRIFQIPIAYGNHCENLAVIYSAISFEPTAIFLYVKGDKVNNHPDEKHAIPLNEIMIYSKNIKLLFKALGNGNKIITNNIIEGQI